MPTYTITEPESGNRLKITGDSPPSEQEIEQIFASFGAPKQETKLDEPTPRKAMSLSDRSRQVAEKRISEREEFLDTLSPEKRELIESINPVQAAAIGAGKGLTDIGRGLGLVEGKDETFSDLQKAFPVASTIGEVAGQSAPFLPLGVAAGGIASLPARAAATAAVGAAEGGLISRGQGGDTNEQIISAGIGGTVAGGLELALPVIGRVGGKIVRRVLGAAPDGAVIDSAGKPSAQFLSALKKEGIEFDDLVSSATKELRNEALDPEQAARKAFLESQGLTSDAAPTRAQITRSVDDFKIQQEALKSSGRVEQRITAQDRVLATRFQEVIEKTGGEANLPASSVSDSLLAKANVLDDEISSLYKQAREITGNEKVVKFSSLSKKLKELAPLNERAGGNVRAVFDTLKQRGLIDKNMRPSGRLGVEETETQVRQLINSLYDIQKSGGDPVNSVLRELKESLDEDVFRSSGEDIFKAARSAKAKFESDLTRAKISKFDKRTRNLVRDILENKDTVSPDNFTDNVVFGKAWRDSDLKQLKDYISTEGHGKAAWNDLRADVLQSIKEKSFIGAEDARGFQSLSRDKIEKAIDSIGMNKMKVLFEPEEIAFLNNLKKVAALREPRKMTGSGLGPSAQAILSLEKKLKDLPLIGQVLGFLDIDASGRMAVRSAPAYIKQSSKVSKFTPPLSIGAGALAVDAVAEEQNQ